MVGKVKLLLPLWASQPKSLISDKVVFHINLEIVHVYLGFFRSLLLFTAQRASPTSFPVLRLNLYTFLLSAALHIEELRKLSWLAGEREKGLHFGKGEQKTREGTEAWFGAVQGNLRGKQ